jgi:hypothetical protein
MSDLEFRVEQLEREARYADMQITSFLIFGITQTALDILLLILVIRAL